MFKKILFLVSALFIVQSMAAQAPAGYYSSTKGQQGRNLKSVMSTIINKGYHSVGYDGLYKAYESTDCRADGKVWDMYSDMTSYDFRNDRAGNYKKEGDCYNREHSFPQSWFNGGRMKSDLFNVYPTDGKINGMRSNYPYGETDGDRFKSHNAWSKLGQSKTPGYSGIVFEPNDEYKGDFARTYFYIATCYESEIANWNSPMLSHDKYTVFAPWAMNMLMRWAKEDPVSEKEINRNNEVYKYQKNRNPYIDFPGLENYVWGEKSSTAFNPDDYVNGGGGEVTPNPQPEPQPEDNVIFSADFAADCCGFTFEDKMLSTGLKYVWSYNQKYHSMKATAAIGQQHVPHASESWALSPMMDLTKTNNTSMTFVSKANFFKTQEEFKKACSVKVKEVGSTEWKNVVVENLPTGQSWDKVTSTVNLQAFDGKQIQVAFVYTSTTQIAGTWEFVNVQVVGNAGGEVGPEPTPDPEPQPEVANGALYSTTNVMEDFFAHKEALESAKDMSGITISNTGTGNPTTQYGTALRVYTNNVLNIQSNNQLPLRKIVLHIESDKFVDVVCKVDGENAEVVVDKKNWTITWEGYATEFVSFEPSGSKARIYVTSIETQFNALGLNISDAGYATFATDQAYTMAAGLQGGFVVVEGDVAKVNYVYGANDVVPSNEALVIKGAEGGYILPISTSTGVKNTNNQLVGALTNEVIVAPENAKLYILSTGAKGLGFYFQGVDGDGSKVINMANKAYLQVSGAAAVNGFRLVEGDTTGLDSVETTTATGAIYTLAGVRVNVEKSNLPKGIYIINGKKVLVK